jgi:hypothetical protein
VALFSGSAEDMFAGLTSLPSGWSVEWVVSRPTLTLLIDVSYGLHRDIIMTLVIFIHLL